MKLIWAIVVVFLAAVLSAVFYLSGAILAHSPPPANQPQATSAAEPGAK